jgi:hypothetical protein
MSEELQQEAPALHELLGDTRRRFRQRHTPNLSAEELIEVDREIVSVLALPLTAELQPEVRRLTARLKSLDPH